MVIKIKVLRVNPIRGLLFRRKTKTPVLLKIACGQSGINTWGILYFIDVVWLGENFRVLHIKRDLRPFSYYNPQIKAKYVLEFPAGMACVGIGEKMDVEVC